MKPHSVGFEMITNATGKTATETTAWTFQLCNCKKTTDEIIHCIQCGTKIIKV